MSLTFTGEQYTGAQPHKHKWAGKQKSRLEKVLVLMRMNTDKSNAGAIVWTVTIEACSNGGMNHFSWQRHTDRISRTWLVILHQRLELPIEKFVGFSFFTRVQPCWYTPIITRYELNMSSGCCGKKILHHDGTIDKFYTHLHRNIRGMLPPPGVCLFFFVVVVEIFIFTSVNLLSLISLFCYTHKRQGVTIKSKTLY